MELSCLLSILKLFAEAAGGINVCEYMSFAMAGIFGSFFTNTNHFTLKSQQSAGVHFYCARAHSKPKESLNKS
jgi:hypothetical protein